MYGGTRVKRVGLASVGLAATFALALSGCAATTATTASPPAMRPTPKNKLSNHKICGGDH